MAQTQRQEIYEEWTGPLAEDMPVGEYFGVKILDSKRLSLNGDVWQIWNQLSMLAAKFSTNPACATDVLTRELVAGGFKSLNLMLSAVAANVVTRFGTLFPTVYGDPPAYRFEAVPIRWPATNGLALAVLQAMASAVYQIPHLASNRVQIGLLDNHGGMIVRPLVALKARLMRILFGREVQGDVSVDELQAIFRNVPLAPPPQDSMTDGMDVAADTAAEDAKALTVENAERPTDETMERVRAGTEIYTFVPSKGDWAVFAEKLRREEIGGAFQPTPATFLFSNSEIGSTLAAGAGAGAAPAATATTTAS